MMLNSHLSQFIPALPPILATVRSQMLRRRQAALAHPWYVEPGDPAIRSLVAAEMSLQLLVEYVLVPVLERQLDTIIAFHEQINLLVDTLSLYVGATSAVSNVVPVISAKIRTMHLPSPAAVDLTYALMLLIMSALENGSELVYISMPHDDRRLVIVTESTVHPLRDMERYGLVVQLISRYDGELTVTNQPFSAEDNAEHWVTHLVMPLRIQIETE